MNKSYAQNNNSTPKTEEPKDTRQPPAADAERNARNALRNQKLQELRRQKQRANSDLFEERRKITRIQAELRKLQQDADNDAQEQTAGRTWATLIPPSVTRPAATTPEERAERELRRVERATAKRIKECILDRYQAAAGQHQKKLDEIDKEIEKIQREIQQETQAKSRTAEEERLQKEHEERLKKAREAQAARARAEREQQRQAEAERRWREFSEELKAEREAARKAAAELLQRQSAAQQKKYQQNQRQWQRQQWQNQTRSYNSSGSCTHGAYWTRVDGSYLCSRCDIITRKFAFDCPRCHTKACAQCRDILKVDADM